MQKMRVIQSLYRSLYLRSSSAFSIPAGATAATAVNHHSQRHLHFSSNPFHELRNPSTVAIRSMCSFSEDVAPMPDITDLEIKRSFKDLMATSWDELPNVVVGDAEHALTKTTDDKAGQEILINVFRAAEAVEEFTGILKSLKMDIDDEIGLTGENAKPMSRELSDAIQTVFQRYTTYLSAFGSDEGYLKKKVEMELGNKMIYLKMRCSGLDPEWGQVTVLGTSGLAGSYVEHRA